MRKAQKDKEEEDKKFKEIIGAKQEINIEDKNRDELSNKKKQAHKTDKEEEEERWEIPAFIRRKMDS